MIIVLAKCDDFLCRHGAPVCPAIRMQSMQRPAEPTACFRAERGTGEGIGIKDRRKKNVGIAG